MSIAPAPSGYTSHLSVELLDGVHVWVLPQYDAASTPEVRPEGARPEEARLEDDWWNLLSTDELERARRFHFAHHATAFVANRARLRILLGWYLEQAPAELNFTYSASGKPELSSAYGEIAFNLSHTEGLALVALARRGRVGVDIEKMQPASDSLDLARSYFSAHELQELTGCPDPAERQATFYRCWTRKEAFLKALGDGLSRPLSAFTVSCGRQSAKLLACNWEANAPAAWQLTSLEFGDSYAAALAYEGEPGGLPVSPRIHHWQSDL